MSIEKQAVEIRLAAGTTLRRQLGLPDDATDETVFGHPDALRRLFDSPYAEQLREHFWEFVLKAAQHSRDHARFLLNNPMPNMDKSQIRRIQDAAEDTIDGPQSPQVGVRKVARVIRDYCERFVYSRIENRSLTHLRKELLVAIRRGEMKVRTLEMAAKRRRHASELEAELIDLKNMIARGKLTLSL